MAEVSGRCQGRRLQSRLVANLEERLARVSDVYLKGKEDGMYSGDWRDGVAREGRGEDKANEAD